MLIGNTGKLDTELVVNAARRATVHADTESQGDEDAATGFAILHLNSGDNVYIRSYGAQGVLHNLTISGHFPGGKSCTMSNKTPFMESEL